MKEIGSLLGKTLLVGITLLTDDDELIEQVQVYGPIVRVDGDGIVILRSPGNTEFAIPPDFGNLTDAARGEYRLHTTGEVVVDPDLISSWTFRCENEKALERWRQVGFAGCEPSVD